MSGFVFPNQKVFGTSRGLTVIPDWPLDTLHILEQPALITKISVGIPCGKIRYIVEPVGKKPFLIMTLPAYPVLKTIEK